MMLASTLFAGLALVLGAVEAQQEYYPFPHASSSLAQATPHLGDSSFADTIVSTLSASTQHTTLLRLLQRSKCIPLLAHINASTVFAPTDKAWEEWEDRHRPPADSEIRANGWLGIGGLAEWIDPSVGEENELDNHNWALRQHLLYHMLNYTLPPHAFFASAKGQNVTIETTLLFPLAEEPVHPPVPEPGPPWLPRGGEGLLGGHGQRIRIARAGSEAGGEMGKVGVDWSGAGGAAVGDGSWWEKSGNDSLNGGDGPKDKRKGVRWTRNGLVVGVNGVLDPPPSIESVIRSHPSLQYLSRLLTASEPLPNPLPEDFRTTPHLTVFAPSDDAFQGAFDDIEKRYLEGGYGAEGVARVVGGGVVLGVGKKQDVGWSDHWGEKQYQAESASGQELLVEATGSGNLSVNGTRAAAVDIFASNGVIHILPSLVLPGNFTLLNSAEKVLLSLNATRFVSLLRSANIADKYVGLPGKEKDKEEAWTILAPTDEVLDMMDRWAGHGGPPIPEVWTSAAASVKSLGSEPFEDGSPLASLLQYHIIPGRLLPGGVRDGMLLGTELRTSALGGGRQRLRVDVARRLDREEWDDVEAGEIRFGGMSVLDKPVKTGKSIIYLVSGLLSPPDDVLQTAVSDLQLSTFIAAVYAADLEKSVRKSPATTYFVPRNRAFNNLGLTMQYLLLPEGKDDLRKVVRYHAIDEVIYTNDISDGKQVYPTLEGGEIVLEKTEGKNSTITLRSPTKWEGHDSGANLPANGEIRPARVTRWDALTETGVIHTLDSVILPADVRISIGKLVRGSKQSTMMELMVKAGLGWVLEGREPDADEVNRAVLAGIVRPASDSDDIGQPVPDMDSLALPSYTLLVPTDKAFSRLNLTHYLSDKDALLDLLKLHIIPTQPSTPRTETSKKPASPPEDGRPLSMDDDLVYSTLLSASSKYGDVAFRATGDYGFIVGIRNARNGLTHASGRIGASGRASVRWRSRSGALDSAERLGKEGTSSGPGLQEDDVLWRNGMTLGGGVMVIDNVLVPYQPSWWSRWGWLVLTLSGIGLVTLIAAISFGWWWMTRKDDKEGYEALEGEEEE